MRGRCGDGGMGEWFRDWAFFRGFLKGGGGGKWVREEFWFIFNNKKSDLTSGGDEIYICIYYL